MSYTRFTDIKDLVLNKLKGLDPNLYYHNIGHTLDVLSCAEKIAEEEGVSDKEQRFLLKVAAVYHDTGFLRTYTGHEKISCDIFSEDAALFGLNQEQKETVRHLIMATRVPQQPQGLLQKIICDADLDYLGREDFFKMGDKLRQEFLYYGIVANEAEWKTLQLTFLSNHHYHTDYSQKNREPVKQSNYSALIHTEPG